MKSLLKKLDDLAGHYINTLDDQLQGPIVHAMTGQVFTHGAPSNGYDCQDEQAQQPLIASASHKPEVAEQETPCPPELRQASALGSR